VQQWTWIPLRLLFPWWSCCWYLTWCGMKNTFGILVYSLLFVHCPVCRCLDRIAISTPCQLHLSLPFLLFAIGKQFTIIFSDVSSVICQMWRHQYSHFACVVSVLSGLSPILISYCIFKFLTLSIMYTSRFHQKIHFSTNNSFTSFVGIFQTSDPYVKIFLINASYKLIFRFLLHAHPTISNSRPLLFNGHGTTY
jgi:hypothetical protein